MVALEAELAKAKTADVLLVGLPKRPAKDATNVREDHDKTKIYFGKVEQKVKLVSATLDET